MLTIWGMKVQDYAQLLVPTGTADSTGIEGYVGGALKQSLTFALDLAKKTVTIGSNLFYSVYVELGTWESLPRKETDAKRRGSGRTSTASGTYPGHESPPVPAPGGGRSH